MKQIIRGAGALGLALALAACGSAPTTPGAESTSGTTSGAADTSATSGTTSGAADTSATSGTTSGAADTSATSGTTSGAADTSATSGTTSGSTSGSAGTSGTTTSGSADTSATSGTTSGSTSGSAGTSGTTTSGSADTSATSGTTSGSAGTTGTTTSGSTSGSAGTSATTTSGSTSGATDSVLGAAATDPRFSTLAGLLETSGLSTQLEALGPFTLFAPTNEAFAALPAGSLDTLAQNPSLLQQILLYHVAEGAIRSEDITGNVTATTAEGQDLQVGINDGTVTVNGTAEVIDTDIEAGQGVIHVIDEVLLPPGVALGS